MIRYGISGFSIYFESIGANHKWSMKALWWMWNRTKPEKVSFT